MAHFSSQQSAHPRPTHTLIIGVDPGLQKTGFGLVEVQNNKLTFVACGNFKTSTKDGLAIRLRILNESLAEILAHYRPKEAALEEVFINKNPQSSIKLIQARGVLLLGLAQQEIPVYAYSPTQIKKSVVGSGRADKDQVEKMIRYLLPKANPQTSDEADALAMALTHAHLRGTQAERLS